MPANPASSFLRQLWPPRPWPVLGIGVGITLVGLVLTAFGDALAGVRFTCFLAGLITAGVAVSLRLKTAGQAFDERVESAGVLAVAAFAALLAYLGTDQSWDSLHMVLVVLVIVPLLGVVLVLLPTPARMLVVGALVIVHFGGMITAATTISPPGSEAPWVSQELWVRFYRPYLQFMYLNNAYHFYSPEPGPPALVWFHIKYKDGRVKWFKIPHHDDDPVPIHHMRLLSITESTSLTYTRPPEDPLTLMNIKFARVKAGDEYGIPLVDENFIQIAVPQNESDPGPQYQEPQPYSQKMIESYVRHVAHEFPWLGDAGNPVSAIKVYRFRQNMINPEPMAEHRNPTDPTLFSGYYEGEYDRNGKMLHPDIRDEQGNLLQRQDPFLYWYIPIYYRTTTGQPWTPETPFEDLRLKDCLTRHARLDLDNRPVSPASTAGLLASPVGQGPFLAASALFPGRTDLDQPLDLQSNDPNDSPWKDGAEKSP